MKRFLSLILTLSIAAVIFTACKKESEGSAPPPSVTTISYDHLIKELEDKILSIQKDSLLSEAEAQKQIAELQAQIEELKKADVSSTSQTIPSATTTLSKAVFIYSIENGNAIITGFTGDGDTIVIPSAIDGFEVYGIASNAFEDYSFKSVIISDGVEKIDWFAFYNCKELQSITIPSSVRKIGYSAFDGCSKQFTIYCQSGSFAQSYAQSYGITYAVI